MSWVLISLSRFAASFCDITHSQKDTVSSHNQYLLSNQALKAPAPAWRSKTHYPFTPQGLGRQPLQFSYWLWVVASGSSTLDWTLPAVKDPHHISIHTWRHRPLPPGSRQEPLANKVLHRRWVQYPQDLLRTTPTYKRRLLALEFPRLGNSRFKVWSVCEYPQLHTWINIITMKQNFTIKRKSY